MRIVVVIPGFFLERIMRRGVPLRTSRNIKNVKKERPTGAGTCISDINNGTVHRCADFSSPLSSVHNPGWE